MTDEKRVVHIRPGGTVQILVDMGDGGDPTTFECHAEDHSGDVHLAITTTQPEDWDGSRVTAISYAIP